MSKEMDLLKRILATGWLDHELSCEVEELLAQPEYEADRRSDPISKLRNLRDIQGRKGNYDIDEYMRGLYNGLELSLSIFEDRGPDYKEPIAQPEQPEQEPIAYVADPSVPLHEREGLTPREALTEYKRGYVRNLRDIQGRKGNYDIDEYMRGLYNDLELSLSIFEDRGPDYKEHIAQPEIRELLTQKREPLSEQVIWNANTEQLFEEGVRWAEKAHGIGVDNE